MTADDIADLIASRQVELNELEYKQQANDTELLRAACAIANAGGGFILVGVAEDAEHCASGIISVERPQDTADSIRQKLRDGLAPRPSIEVVPLAIGIQHIVIVRVAPQNPPHMVSADKRSDFYGRYDATSERMRYEEIEQRFRDKFSSGQLFIPETPQATLETLSGRREVSAGSAGVLDHYVQTFIDSQDAVFGLIAVQDSFANAVTDGIASWLFSDPSYSRKAGWLVIHPSLSMVPLGGRWQQDYGKFSRTYLNASGDLIFQKAVDEVLCWTQNALDFERCPRLYPNALIEYCLSFVYAVSDIAAISKPRKVLIKPVVLAGANGMQLPLGEGGSVWFDAPAGAPTVVKGQQVGITMLLEPSGAIHVRREAFKLAAQIYGFFNHADAQVPFSRNSAITFESGTTESAITAARSYLQGRLGLAVRYNGEQSDRSVHWFGFDLSVTQKRVSFGFTEEFLDDFGAIEDTFFQMLNSADIENAVQDWGTSHRPIMTTEGLDFVGI